MGTAGLRDSEMKKFPQNMFNGIRILNYVNQNTSEWHLSEQLKH